MLPPPATDGDPAAAPPGQATAWRPALLGAVLLALWGALVGTVLTPLALHRHFHVDEVQVAFNAALLGFHHLPEWLNFRTPFVVVLSWIAAGMEGSWPALLEMRSAFFVLFLVDLVLVALSAPRLRGFPARAAALLAFTLVQPFWRHGFEIRSDVLLLAGALALFALNQRAATGRLRWPGLLAAGALAGWMQVNQFKAFLWWIPGLLLLLVVRHVAERGRRLVPAVALLAAGFALALAMSALLLAAAGVLGDTLRQTSSLAGAASEARRFGVGTRLGAVLGELPHLALLALLSLLHCLRVLAARGGRGELTSLTTNGWLGIQFVALFVNPLPFSYNLVHLIPFVFLAAVDGLALLWHRWPRGRLALAAAAGVVSLLAFANSWSRDLVGRTGDGAQRAYVETAEALTAPSDPVLDGAGLVLSRRPPGRDWMLHSLFMPAYRRGERLAFRELLRRDPAPVLLTNYRWRWLSAEDHAFVRAHYVAVARRLLVLGGRSDAAAGTFVVLRGGRYALQPLDPGAALRIDGRPPPADGIVTLAAGSHRWSGSGVAWAWLGPRLTAFPDLAGELPNGDLFISD